MSSRILRHRKSMIGAGLLIVGLAWVVLSGQPAEWCLESATDRLQQQDWQSAESRLDWAASLRADPQEILFLRLRLARKLGRHAEVEKRFQQLGQSGFDPQRLRLEYWMFEAQRGRVDLLEDHLSELFVAGEELQEVCEAFVLGCLQGYRLKDAHRILDLWESDFPADAQPHFLRARLLEHSSNLEKAEKFYREAVRLNPRHAAAAYGLGRTLLQAQKQEEALSWFELCADEGLSRQPGLIGMARCYRELGQYENAAIALTQADDIEDQASIEESWKLVGEPRESIATQRPGEWGQLELARGNYPAAAKYLEQAMAANPYAWRLRYHLGQALLKLGRLETGESQILRFNETKEALARCDPLIDQLRKDPTDVEARYEVGSVMLKYISPNQGLVWLNSVLNYDPQHYLTHRLLAEFFETHADDQPTYPELGKEHRSLANRLRPQEMTVPPDVSNVP